jgi:hypothetical protein
MNKKYWIAIGEHGSFTKNDHYIFQVFFTGQSNGKGYGLMPRFIEAESLEVARAQLHAFVDERIDHEFHMLHVDKGAQKIKEKRDAFKARPPVKDSDIDSLSIGGFVGDKPKPKDEHGGTEGLLNLGDLV